MKIIAHRGASLNYPGNTFLAFDHAIDAGAEALETDVRMSSDGRLILRHDDLIEYRGQLRPVRDLSYRQLLTLPLQRRQHIPLLEELLDRYGGMIPLILELKEPGLAEPVARCLKDLRLENSCEVTSFHLSELMILKRLSPYLPLSLALTAFPQPLAAILKEKKIRTVSLQRSFVTRPTVQFLRQKKIDVRVYAVNCPREAARYFAWGVKAIFTDDPAQMTKFIRS